jgi:hypothetical protein
MPAGAEGLTKTEECSLQGLKSDASLARIPSFDSFRQIAGL